MNNAIKIATQDRNGLVHCDELIRGLPDFWSRVRQASRLVLALDYDGTLAPFRIDRMSAYPLPGVLETLDKIKSDTPTRVLLVSGRPIRELRRLTGDCKLEMIGAHGWEEWRPQGIARRYSLNYRQMERLEFAWRIMSEAGYSRRMESKPASVALHTRGAADAEEIIERAMSAWRPLANDSALELRLFDGGVELRASGRNKGTAINTVLRGEMNDTLAVYLGDDETDEDVFRTLRGGRGIGIKIGDDDTPTAATGRIRNCAEVPEFLKAWYAVRRDADAVTTKEANLWRLES